MSNKTTQIEQDFTPTLRRISEESNNEVKLNQIQIKHIIANLGSYQNDMDPE